MRFVKTIPALLLIVVAAVTSTEDKSIVDSKLDGRDKRNLGALEYTVNHNYPAVSSFRLERRLGPAPTPHSSMQAGLHRSYSNYYQGAASRGRNHQNHGRKLRPNAIPPYAVQMEPLVQYSQRDPLYESKKQREIVSNKLSENKQHDLIGEHNHVINTYATANDRYDHLHAPSYYPKEPEPIIEIIIKESNESLPPPPSPPPAPPKKKEQVQVFYVKYKKNPNGYGKDDVIYDAPVPAVTPATNNQDEHEHEHDHHPAPLPPPDPVTYAPPPSTTLRTIIRPDSETYHSDSGVHVTFGSEHYHNEKTSSANEEPEETAPQPSVAHPLQQKRQPVLNQPPPSFPLQPQPIVNNEYRTISQAPLSYNPLQFQKLPQPPQFLHPSSQPQFRPFPSSPLQFTRPPLNQFNSGIQFRPQPQFRPQTLQQQLKPNGPPPQFQPLPTVNQRLPFNQGHSTQFFNVPFNQQNNNHQVYHTIPQEHRLPPINFLNQPHNQPQPAPTQPPHIQQLPHHQVQQPFSPQHLKFSPQINAPQFSQPLNVHHSPQPSISHQHLQQQPQQQQSIPRIPQHNIQPQQNIPHIQQQQNHHIQPQHNSQNIQSHNHQSNLHNIQSSQNTFQHHQNNPHVQPQPHIQAQQNFGHIHHQQLHQQNNHQQITQNQHIVPPGGELIHAIPKFEQHLLYQNNQPLSQEQYQQQIQQQFKQSLSPSPSPTPTSVELQKSHQTQQQEQNQLQQQQQQNHLQQQQNQLQQQQNQLQQLQFKQQQQQQQNSQQFLHVGNFESHQQAIQLAKDTLIPQHLSPKQENVVTITPPSVKYVSSTSSPLPTYRPQLSSQPAIRYSSTTPQPTVSSTSQPTEKSPTEEEKNKDDSKFEFELPDEVPDDLRQQLISSGILKNAHISVLDYDKVGDIPIDALPPDQLANFYNAGGAQQIAGSAPIPKVVKTDGRPVKADDIDSEQIPGAFEESASELHEVVAENPKVEMKVVHFDRNSQEGQSVADKYVRDDAKHVEPVVLDDNNYTKYLPLKINGAHFPIPNVPELNGRNVTSVVVLAPITEAKRIERDTRRDVSDGADTTTTALKKVVKNPSTENFKKWLDKEKKEPSDKQSVVLLVTDSTSPSSNNKREIFMYDVLTDTVSKLNGELSSAFVDAAETNVKGQEYFTADASNKVENKIQYPNQIQDRIDTFSDDLIEPAASEFVETGIKIFNDDGHDLVLQASEPSEQYASLPSANDFPISSSSNTLENHVSINSGYSKTGFVGAS